MVWDKFTLRDGEGCKNERTEERLFDEIIFIDKDLRNWKFKAQVMFYS